MECNPTKKSVKSCRTVITKYHAIRNKSLKHLAICTVMNFENCFDSNGFLPLPPWPAKCKTIIC